MFQTKVVEKIKTNILSAINFSHKRGVFEIMLKTMVRKHTTQMTVGLFYSACPLHAA